MEERILQLLEENNKLLKEILKLLNYLNSKEYRETEDLRALNINLTANALFSIIDSNPELKEQIRSRLNL